MPNDRVTINLKSAQHGSCHDINASHNFKCHERQYRLLRVNCHKQPITRRSCQLAIPASMTWSASGTQTAKGYTSESTETASVEGLKQDCDNIDFNGPSTSAAMFLVSGLWVSSTSARRLATIPTTTGSPSVLAARLDKLCDTSTTYPIIHDQQHDTWFIDEPFDCTR